MVELRFASLLLVSLAACPAPAASETQTGGPATTSETESESGSESESEGGSESETGDASACPAQTPGELMDCVEQDRYLDDLQFIADVRTPGSPHWQAVQDLCADRFAELGYEVELHDYGTGVNVLGTKLGTQSPDEHVLVGGHYDHIPGCSGADDNGSGVAATLEIARVLADMPSPRTLVVVCWDEEELGLLGSAAHAQAALDAGEQITAVFDLDSMGYATAEPNSQVVPEGFDLLFPEEYAELVASGFRGDFLLWVSDDTMQALGAELDGYADAVGLWTLGTSLDDVLKNADLLADLRRSDHASFWSHDIPALWLNDTGEFRYPSYHCGEGDDIVEQVDLEFAVQVTQVTLATTGSALGL